MSEPARSIVSKPRGWRRWVTLRSVGFLVVLVLSIIFVVENDRDVRTHFVFFTVTTKLWVGFLACLVLGAILGQVGTMLWRRQRTQQHGAAPAHR